MPEKIKRRVPSKSEVLEILTRQGTDLRGFAVPRAATTEARLFALIIAHIGRVPCGNFAVCGTWITAKAECRRDHRIPLRQIPIELRPDYDGPKNQWYLCISCDKHKTFRRGHNSAGLSDATLNAKLRRQERRFAASQEPKERSAECLTTRTSAGWKKASTTPWPKGRKIANRPFPTGGTRPSLKGRPFSGGPR